jgi:hypothetical protein
MQFLWFALAVVIWAALVWLEGDSVLAGLQRHMPRDTSFRQFTVMVVAFFVVCMVGAYLIPRLVKTWLAARRAALEAAEARENNGVPDEFTPELRARFPAKRIYFVPKKLRDYLKIGPETENAWFSENFMDWWNDIFRQYPTPPLNAQEVAERESGFWNYYSDYMTVRDTFGRDELKPKREIVDYFETYEKWVLRHYFAATGIFKETIVKEMCRHLLDEKRAYELPKHSDYRHLQLEKTHDAMRNFTTNIMPDYFKRESGWFFSNIKQVFDNKHNPASDFGPQTPTTPLDHRGDEELDYKPNV